MISITHLGATTTGTTGSATGSAASANIVSGHVEAIYVTVPTGGTCTATLAMQGGAGSENVLSLSGITSSAWYYPRKPVVGIGGTAVTYDGTNNVCERFVVCDYMVLSVTSATTAKTFEADVYMEE